MPSEKKQNEPNANSFYYINKGDNEILVIFVKRNLSYEGYDTFFQLCTKLYKYIKTGCKIAKSFNNFDVLIAISNSFLVTIIYSITLLSDFNFGLDFRK